MKNAGGTNRVIILITNGKKIKGESRLQTGLMTKHSQILSLKEWGKCVLFLSNLLLLFCFLKRTYIHIGILLQLPELWEHPFRLLMSAQAGPPASLRKHGIQRLFKREGTEWLTVSLHNCFAVHSKEETTWNKNEWGATWMANQEKTLVQNNR